MNANELNEDLIRSFPFFVFDFAFIDGPFCCSASPWLRRFLFVRLTGKRFEGIGFFFRRGALKRRQQPGDHNLQCRERGHRHEYPR